MPGTVHARRQLRRRVEFLELFFDLVFVVLVSQLAHRLAEHPSWGGAAWFAFLFLAVWWSWANGTWYHDAHGTNDLSIRVFTFGLMLSVAFMAVYAGDVPGDGAAGFAMAYAANSALLTIMWFRTGYHDPAHRSSSYPYVAAYALATVLFVVSANLGEPTIYWLWGIALAIELAAVIPSIRVTGFAPDPPVATPSLIERLGLLVIIVLGEVVLGAIDGMAHHDPVDATIAVVGGLGIVVAIGLWWLYFDGVSHRQPDTGRQYLWFYLHFPLVAGIAAAGAGVVVLLEQTDHLADAGRWLLVGSVAVALAAITVLSRTLGARRQLPQVYGAMAIVASISIALILLVGTTSLDAMATLAAVAMLLLAPVAISIPVLLQTTDPADVDD